MADLPRSTTITFVWMDENFQDFQAVRQSFCKRTFSTETDWTYFNTRDKCTHFIQQADSKQNLVLISSGRFIADMIHHLHNLPQIHSIYIYCHKKDKYESFKNSYRKVRGIFDNPVQLDDRMYSNLEEEIRPRLSVEVRNESVPIPRITRLHCLWKNELRSYYTPDISWCIWQTNGCVLSLPIKGQGTIEFWLREPIPFELCLSSNETNTNALRIVLKIDTREAQLSARNDQLDSTIELHQVLQADDNEWHCYWLTFYSIGRLVQYGMGEVRPKFKILELPFEENQRMLLANISHLHVKLNHSNDIHTMEYLKDKVKIFIGKEPVLFDPPLVIISPEEFSPTCPVNNHGIFANLLPDPLRNRYHQMIDFTVDDPDFPTFIETIERSIKTPNSWCYRKLREKVHQFGRARLETTCLCISINTFTMKIWPPGHYSPIHHHRDAYGLIRVLHGKLLVKYFPTLSLHSHVDTLIEQLFEKDSLTWMVPKLNQIHQMKNPDMYGSCCITIQAFHYETDVPTPVECFRYITNDHRRIENYQCTPDESYLTFKRIMQMESTSESTGW